jgi:hypothetical protein
MLRPILRPLRFASEVVPRLLAVTRRSPNVAEKWNGRVERLDISRRWRKFIERLKEFDKQYKRETIYATAKKLLKQLRVFSKLLLFLIAPAFFLFYGFEIVTIAYDRSQQSLEGAWYYWVLGSGLIIMGFLLYGLLAVAYFSREPAGEGNAANANGENASGINNVWVGAALISVDVIAVGIIFIFVLLAPLHEFRWAPLRTVQNQIIHWTSDPAITSIRGVTNNADEAVEFIVRHNELGVSVHAIGEEAVREKGVVEWVDSGWIEDAKKDAKIPRVWEMKDGGKTVLKDTPPGTSEVTGSRELKPGRYILRYTSDGSASVNLCAKEKHKPYSDLKVTVLSRQDKEQEEDKEKEPPPAFSSCLRIMVTVNREPTLRSLLTRAALYSLRIATAD